MFVNATVHANIRTQRAAYGIGCCRVLYSRRLISANI